MDKFLDKYQITSRRKAGWDYHSAGKYFITIATRNRHCSFGKILKGTMHPSQMGETAEKFWRELPCHFPNVHLDKFVIMPDHIHGIIVLHSKIKLSGVEFDLADSTELLDPGVETLHEEAETLHEKVETLHATSLPLPPQYTMSQQTEATSTSQFMSCISPKRGSLGTVIRSYKSACTKKFNELHGETWIGWQPNYHDHIIRNNIELHQIRQYISDNPKNWKE